MAFFKRDDIVIKYGGDDSRFQKVNRRVMTTGKKLKGFFADVGSSILYVKDGQKIYRRRAQYWLDKEEEIRQRQGFFV